MAFLANGSQLELVTEGKSVTVIIGDFLGAGGSCVAYNVSYIESDEVQHRGVLKEYCPAFLDRESDDLRNADGSLNIPDEFFESFENGLSNFKSTYVNINKYLYNNMTATNYHPVQLGLYEGNNTAYTLTSCDYGKTYDKVTDNSIYDMLCIVLSVARAVELYHNAGFLHLDIKPKNVLILDGVKDMIKLFDYDSLTSIELLRSGRLVSYPVPEDYYVPELSSGMIYDIGVTTDVFEIGAMLFEKLFERSPLPEDMAFDSQYDFDSVQLLNGISPMAKYQLEQLFKHTLQVSKRQRYKTIVQLEEALEGLIELVKNDKAHLVDLPKWQPSKYCVGRQDELRELKKRLDRDSYVFIKAMGGTGKSELAKLFAQKYAGEYHTVQFCKYNGSLKSVVLSLAVDEINDSDFSSTEELVREKNKILHSSDKHTLLIIDNFNVTYDDFLRDFLPSDSNSFKVIFTTRCMPAAEYYDDKVMSINNLPADVAESLFFSRSMVEENNHSREFVKSILETIQYNTLVLVLVAQTIRNRSCSLEDMDIRLKESRLDSVDGKVFHEYDFSSIDGESYNKVFAHLNTIFNISNLSAIQKEILKNLTLIANIGIGMDLFIEYCENVKITESDIYQLINMGWINVEDNWIVLHPIVSDLIYSNNDVPREKSFEKLADNMVVDCYAFDDIHIDAVNIKFAYLSHLDKRYTDVISFTSIDIKLSLAKQYRELFEANNAKKKYSEAAEMIKQSFRFKPRNCFVYFGLAEIEEDFGSIDKAIDLYKKAVQCCKKLPNMFYDIHFDSIRGIGSCYSEKHDFESAYEYYLKAYKYTQGFDSGDIVKRFLFPSQTKDLSASIPELCDRIIEVCAELEKFDEIDKFKKIKCKTLDGIRSETAEENLDEFDEFCDSTKHMDKAMELFRRGNLKDGMRELNKYMAYAKDLFGEDSPQYKDVECQTIPLVAIASNNSVSYQAFDNCIEFIREKYGENSKRFADYLVFVSIFISDTADYEITEKYTKKAKEIYTILDLTDSYNYQEANLIMIDSLILQGKVGELKSLVDEIDFSMFKSKQDFEKLVKYAGYALVEIKEYDKAVDICTKLIEKENVTPFIKLIAYDSMILALLEQGKTDIAFSYLPKEKIMFNELDDSPQKDMYLSNYICNLSQAYSQKGNYEEAVSVIDEFLKNNQDNETFINNMLLAKLYAYRTDCYRYMHDFERALESIKDAIYLLESDLIYKFKIRILYLLSVCFAANSEIDIAITYFNEFENAFYTESEYTHFDMLDHLIYFIDALIVGRSYKCYIYIEKAEDLVRANGFESTLQNAQLENYIGVYLSDYEEEHGWARDHFEKSKEILESLGDNDSDLYKQVLSNIDYVRDIIVKQIVSDMAKTMKSENESYNNEEDDDE